MRFAEANRKLYRPFPAFSFFTSLRSLRQLAAPHLTGARHSATATTLHTRGDACCTKATNSGHMLCSLNRPVWQTLVRVREKNIFGQACYSEAVERACLPLSGMRAALERSSRAGALIIVRRARTQQSGKCAYHGQACAQRCDEAPTIWSGVPYRSSRAVRLSWSGVRAVPGRSSGARVLCGVTGKSARS